MSLKERLFLACIPLVVLGYFFWKTPAPPDGGYVLDHAVPAGWHEVVDDTNAVIHVRWLLAGRALNKPLALEVMRRRFNIEVDPIYLTPEAMMTAQPLMLSAGDIPDVLDPGGSENLRKYAYHGYLMVIPYELLAARAPAVLREVNQHIPNVWPSLAYDSHNYGFLPRVWYDGTYPRLGIWRMDWLRRVGIDKVPATVDEYHTALRRFRFDDPDGNGLRDTYGMSGDLLSQYVTFTEIFGAFGVMPYDWILKDGEVVWGGVQPEAREALKLLHTWYREELIHPDYLTDRWFREVPGKFENGRIGYVNYMASYEAFNTNNPNSLIKRMRTLQPDSELAPGVPPIGPRGQRGHRVWGGVPSMGLVAFGKQMAQRPEAVVRVLKFYEALMTDEDFWRECTIGIQGVHWDWKDPEVGQGSGIRYLAPYDEPELRSQMGLPDDIFLEGTRQEVAHRYLPKEMIEWEQAHRNPSWGVQDLFYNPNSVPRAEEYLSDLIRLQQVVYADIIRGEAPLEAFDQFVREWHASGGDILLDGARATYREARAILEKVSDPAAAPEERLHD